MPKIQALSKLLPNRRYISINILVCVILYFAQSTIQAQNIQENWESYVSIDAKLRKAMANEQLVRQQQNALNRKMQSLKETKSWYNGWINEMRLARNSATQAKLADSLQILQSKIVNLSHQRKAAFLTLKNTYRQILSEFEDKDNLSPSDKEQAISMGRWIINRNVHPIDLPDYSSIFIGRYNDEKIRQLVMEDLLSVLNVKLESIDSLLEELMSEKELVNRLNEFHRDIGLQSESDRDIGSGKVASVQERANFAGAIDKSFEEKSNYDYYSLKSTQNISNISALETRIATEKALDSPIDLESIEDNITFLEFKRQQYRGLLDQIEKELSQ